jgi:hypothetical protein
MLKEKHCKGMSICIQNYRVLDYVQCPEFQKLENTVLETESVSVLR